MTLYYKLRPIDSEKNIRELGPQLYPLANVLPLNTPLWLKAVRITGFASEMPRMKDRWAALEKVLGHKINHFRQFRWSTCRTAVWGFQFIHCKVAYAVVIYMSRRGLCFEAPKEMLTNVRAVKSFYALMFKVLGKGTQ